MTDLLLKDEVYGVVGAAIEVHKELGPGFFEAVYQEAMEIELTDAGIPFGSQEPVTIHYKGRPLEKQYVPDLICHEQIVVELKAVDALSSQEEAQMINYLKATGLRVGVLINFGTHGRLEWKRLVH